MPGFVTYENVRHKDGIVFPTSPRERTPLDALDCLAFADLGFGGVVTDVTEDADTVSITVQSSCLGCVDISTYTGGREDMRLILRLAELVTMMSVGGGAQASKKRVLMMLGNEHLRSPLVLEMIASNIIGGPRTHSSLLMVLALEHYGENEPTLSKALEAGKKVKIHDLIAAFEIAQQEGVDFIEALELATPLTKVA